MVPQVNSNRPLTSAPSAFVSYCHGDKTHENWVLEFASVLRDNGVKSLLDVWEVQLGGDFIQFMELLPNSDFVLPICSPEYCKKARSGKPSGVKWEMQLLTNALYNDLSKDASTVKVIPILCGGSKVLDLPTHLQSLSFLDFNDDLRYEENLKKLIHRVYGIGSPPDVRALQVGEDGIRIQLRRSEGSLSQPVARREKPKVVLQSVELVDTARHHHVIIALDVVNSSAMPGPRLQQTLEQLRLFMDNHVAIADLEGSHIQNMLDGFVVILQRWESSSKVLDFCREAIEHMKNLRFPVALRAAVHSGPYHFSDAMKAILGAGPNEVTRIARLSGPHQVLVSEDFVRLVQNEGLYDAIELIPKHRPIEVEMKQGQPSKVRIFHGHTGSVDTQPVELSHELQRIQEADNALWDALEGIEDLATSEILKKLSALKRKELGTRLTIFAINKGHLICTQFRRHDGVNGDLPSHGTMVRKKAPKTDKGSTRYSVLDRKRPEGTLGKAYVSRRSVAVVSLPDFRKEPEKYLKVMSSAPWFVPAEKVKIFGRKARSYLAVPFQLSKNSNCECLLCIDFDHPLTELGKKQLEEIGITIEFVYGKLVAALWELRT